METFSTFDVSHSFRMLFIFGLSDVNWFVLFFVQMRCIDDRLCLNNILWESSSRLIGYYSILYLPKFVYSILLAWSCSPVTRTFSPLMSIFSWAVHFVYRDVEHFHILFRGFSLCKKYRFPWYAIVFGRSFLSRSEANGSGPIFPTSTEYFRADAVIIGVTPANDNNTITKIVKLSMTMLIITKLYVTRTIDLNSLKSLKRICFLFILILFLVM